MNNIRTLLFALLLISPFANSAAKFTDAKIDFVFAGYSDGSIAFIPIGGTVNPARCDQTQSYAMLPSSDTRGALSILLAAKKANKKVYFSVRDDVCHAFPQTDNPGSFPVIQRIGIRD
ncbi:hypothetical protein A3715_00970 [Oleiphilus sp. HI0009]|uniref:hypothetical protein n=1 Tax=unclassified Oleiphilus TaxID=2631174 RepID=UPI0007C3F06C|nr:MULTISPECIES: hypothetical protein [unclassified Oleiphilus]KZX82357.1 hypothetical protein A3715_00970 [Oleiphilus sp. HI0009]KZY64309.1 hypothetical protein A3738_10540 [Oleiphilus sp. HI0066]KZY66977.1 hypothetical protein A3739_13155 [Oleiphilus sp. HI0067]